MSILEFKKYSVMDEVVEALTETNDDPLEEAMVIGRRKSGTRFSFMTNTASLSELIGYLEIIKTNLALEMISQSEREIDED